MVKFSLQKTCNGELRMDAEFAYSIQMQIVLAVITCTETFCSMYMLSNILLAALGLSAAKKQKMLFAFVTGTLLQNAVTYGIYFLGGCVSFNHPFYLFVLTPNPVSGLLYYLAAKKIFKLTPVRTIKLASYIYLFWIAAKTLNRIIGAIFFAQNEMDYNYLKDSLQQGIYFIVFIIIYQLAMRSIRQGHTSLSFVDKLFFNRRKELFLFFANATFAFAVRFVLPLVIAEQVTAYILSLVILLLFIDVNVGWDVIVKDKQTIDNHELHISALFKGLEKFRGIKHDINNILHTYSGYLELKEYEHLERYHASLVSATSHAENAMELAQKMRENPAIIALLINKLEYAEKMNVKLIFSLNCAMDDFYIDDLDLSRILSCLLDNAIEAASDTKQRKVYITVEAKAGDSKLIIITNSTAAMIDPNTIKNAGMTTKYGHDGIGLSVVHRTVGKYGNAVFQMKCFDYEFSAYLELKQMA